MLTEQAKEYLKEGNAIRNRHMNDLNEGEELDQRHVDAIVVDLVNFFAAKQGIDLALYTRDLR